MEKKPRAKDPLKSQAFDELRKLIAQSAKRGQAEQSFEDFE